MWRAAQIVRSYLKKGENKMHYVIIGNSAAAVGCIEGIRKVDTCGKITVISKEPYHACSRPLISYLLLGKTDRERMKYRPDNFYEKNGCDLLSGVTVTAIETAKKSLPLDNGKALSYDKLMIAAGSSAFIPPIAGIDKIANKFTFMSLDDAELLNQALSPESTVLIMGAGLIGLKCAEGISKSAQKITVVDLAEHILPSILDESAARLVQDHIESHGINFILGNGVASFEENTATLADGKKIPFDLLVIAVGVRPNVSLAKHASVKVNRGIVTDAYGHTSAEDIYAAGDCAESRDITTDDDKVLALLPNAYMQGECAGINMAGGSALYDKAIPMNAIGFFGYHMMTAGSCLSDDSDAVYTEKTDKSYKKLVTQNGILKGYILVRDIERAGIYTSLIREKTPLDTIDFELIKHKPQLLAFSAPERQKMLGREHK